MAEIPSGQRTEGEQHLARSIMLANDRDSAGAQESQGSHGLDGYADRDGLVMNRRSARRYAKLANSERRKLRIEFLRVAELKKREVVLDKVKKSSRKVKRTPRSCDPVIVNPA